MSGIGGIIYHDPERHVGDELESMQGRLAARGPDGGNLWRGKGAGLAHTLLLIRSEVQQEKQPVVHPGSGAVLVFDGRLDNRQELLAALGCEEGRISDSELCLVAHARWGSGFVSRLAGDFVLALWLPAERTLFCARDRLGVRPLYYTQTAGFFAFSSELPPLLGLPGVDTDIDEQSVAVFWLLLPPESGHTFYSAVSCLPPAQTLTVRAGKEPERAEYWNPRQAELILLRDPREYAEGFRELFLESVACRLRSDRPVGSTLSGGLDSSSIVCAAADLRTGLQPPLHAFSALFPSLPPEQRKSTDEIRYIDAVQAHIACSWHSVAVDRAGPLTHLHPNLKAVGQPFFGANFYLHEELFTEAQRSGIGVFLDGTDGDTIVSHGYECLPAMLINLQLARLFSELQWMRALTGSKDSLARLFYRYAVRPIHREVFYEGRFRPRQALADWLNQEHGLSRDFIARIDIVELFRHLRRLESSPVSNARAHHQHALAMPHLAATLEYIDAIAARYRLEPSFPFLDHRLVEFCVAIPPAEKFRQGWNRHVHRQAMAGILPEPVRTRLTKANLSPHFLNQLQTHGAKLAGVNIKQDRSRLAEWFDDSFLDDLHAASAPGSKGAISLKQAMRLYCFIMLSTWLAEK